jgi:hypothetical protein
VTEFRQALFVLTDTIFVSGNDVITEWALQTTLTEPFFGGLSRKVSVTVHGASIVRTDNGKITDWADYYDGLVSPRTALASYFTDWVELRTAVDTAEPCKRKHSLRRSRKKARSLIAPGGESAMTVIGALSSFRESGELSPATFPVVGFAERRAPPTLRVGSSQT